MMTLELCEGCPALCCRGVEERIKRPRTKLEIESMRWNLHFRASEVFIRNGLWYQLTLSDCVYLMENNLCSNYADRPQVCRSHKPPNCERYYPIYDTILRTPEDLDEWIERDRARTKRRNARKKC